MVKEKIKKEREQGFKALVNGWDTTIVGGAIIVLALVMFFQERLEWWVLIILLLTGLGMFRITDTKLTRVFNKVLDKVLGK